MFRSWKSQEHVTWALGSLGAGLTNKLKGLLPRVGYCSASGGAVFLSVPSSTTCFNSLALLFMCTRHGLRDLECVIWHQHIGGVPEIGTSLGCMLSITSGAVASRSESWLARRHVQTPPSLTAPRWLLKFTTGPYLLFSCMAGPAPDRIGVPGATVCCHEKWTRLAAKWCGIARYSVH